MALSSADISRYLDSVFKFCKLKINKTTSIWIQNNKLTYAID